MGFVTPLVQWLLRWGGIAQSEARRIQAAETLGKRGDPRFYGNKHLNLESDLYLCMPKLRNIQVGKYPVTVGEYQTFVEDGGYVKQEFWEEIGWKINREDLWETPASWETQLEIPNRPVVMVSWYEAMAYCKWLECKMILKGHKKVQVRLLTKDEWFQTAKPNQGDYPWGEEAPSDLTANFTGDSNGGPTPVGIYPRGAGPYGHLDLVGNVWEWSLDDANWESWMDEFLRNIKRKRYPGEKAKALRGGSFCFPAKWGRVTESAAHGIAARHRIDDVGFRVLISIPQ